MTVESAPATDHPPVAKGRKCAQVLEGARRIFMENGFEGASVDDIARAAEVSKATLYSYFPDKRKLFIRVIQDECDKQSNRISQLIDYDAPVEDVLTNAAQSYVEFLMSPFAQEMFRVCVGEASRFPEIGREFYATGPERTRSNLIAFFEDACARDLLKIDDCALAADQFSELCKSDLFYRRVFGLIARPGKKDIARVAKGAVETFMARYGAK